MSKQTKKLRDASITILDVQHDWGGDRALEKRAKAALTLALKYVSLAIYLMDKKEKPDESTRPN